jgi:hypothetical protein
MGAATAPGAGSRRWPSSRRRFWPSTSLPCRSGVGPGGSTRFRSARRSRWPTGRRPSLTPPRPPAGTGSSWPAIRSAGLPSPAVVPQEGGIRPRHAAGVARADGERVNPGGGVLLCTGLDETMRHEYHHTSLWWNQFGQLRGDVGNVVTNTDSITRRLRRYGCGQRLCLSMRPFDEDNQADERGSHRPRLLRRTERRRAPGSGARLLVPIHKRVVRPLDRDDRQSVGRVVGD